MRVAFIEAIVDKDLVFIDESGFDVGMQKEYGWSMKGKRLLGERFGKRQARITLIAGLYKNKFIAPFRFEGYTNAENFNLWVEKILLPELKPNQVVVMDNASFHKNARTKELIESKNCQILYLPPYSPDLNPIEKRWGTIKKIYRNYKHKYQNHYQIIDTLLCNQNVPT